MLHNTLASLLADRRNLTNTGITFIEGSGQEEFMSYRQLYDAALGTLSFFQSLGIQPKNELVIQIEDNKTFIIIFWACIVGGIIPVPLTVGKNDEHRKKIFNVWPVLNNPYLITFQSNFDKLSELAGSSEPDAIYNEIKSRFINQDAIGAFCGEGTIFNASENDIAFIQFSSGSTGNPKGVVLTHKNLITNIAAISNASAYTPADSVLSWMPLTHDMGLIGFHLNPLFSGMHQYLMPTSLFVRRPDMWLRKASEHNVSILCSPNFGYEYVLKHWDNHAWDDLDLSCVRLIYNGAEPISKKICDNFIERLAGYGLKKEAMCPVYGLAEASLAVSISGLEDEIIAVAIDRHHLNTGDKISFIKQGENAVSFLNVGKAVNNCSTRITDDANNPVQDHIIGHVQIKGENVTAGYYNNEEATKKVITADGWLKTGDMGFISQGSIYITGRAKDIIFINGKNYYSHDLERVAEEVEGIELNKIVVAGYFDHDFQKEQVIAFVFHRGNVQEFIPVAAALKTLINLKVGFELNKIIPVKIIPRTTSGKLQRFRLLEQYRTGEFAKVEQELNTCMVTPESEPCMEAQPATENEEKILQIWKRVLKNNSLNVTQNFFETGGNSLNASEIMMQILQEFEVDLPIETLYRKQTIRELAKEIEAKAKQKYIPIPVVQQEAYYPVSNAQHRLYYAWQLNKQAVAYNTPVAFQLNGRVDVKRLENCIKQIINRHDSLRMSFHSDTTPVIKIQEAINFTLECLQCAESELKERLRQLVQPFELDAAPLFRIKLLQVTDNNYILFADFHHIIMDGLSVYNFLEELLSLYTDQGVPALPVQYKDFISWEKGFLQSEKLKEQENYWRNLLQGELPLLEIPAALQRPPVFNTAGEKITFDLSVETTARLKAIARENECTLHALLFTIYYLLLSKYTGQDDLVIGIPVAGRRHPDLQHMLGMFVNNLPIRTSIQDNMPFTQLLATVRDGLLDAFHNQDYPFNELVQNIYQRKDAGRNPVFDTMFNYQNMGLPAVENADFTLSRYAFDPGFSKFDMSMEVFDDGEAIQYAIEYATSLFVRTGIESLAACFETLVKRIIQNPHSNTSSLLLIDDNKAEEYTKLFNNTATVYPKDKTIHRLFEEQVQRTPDKIAVEQEGTTLTYSQLNEQANRLAALLNKKGVVTNSIVAIQLKRSIELVVSILAVLKAGACYVPIDTDLPEGRRYLLITDSRCKLVITEPPFSDDLLLSAPQVAVLTVDDLHTLTEEPVIMEHVATPADPAYIIYTSGTTGNPKGVVIEHASLVNYITWAAAMYIKEEEAAFPLYTSVSFDLTVTSIFTPLITGNKIVIYGDDEKSFLLEKIIRENKVQVVKCTPSHLRLITDEKLKTWCRNSLIKRFIVGGEQLETRLAINIYQQFDGHIEIYNEYGPTEATVGCMIHAFDHQWSGANVPIGIPAANTQIYILDRFMQAVPVNVSGELYISGDGLARGYLYQEELTAKKFVTNPFTEGGRLYKTGDKARRLPNGIIEYIDRFDRQVKINGHRLELSEVENQVAACPGVKEALMVLKETTIYAYYIPDKTYTDPVNEIALRNYLATRLPYYMMPQHFIEITAIPLTSNGKVDYRMLPDKQLNPVCDTYTAPSNHIEAISLEIWQDTLGRKEIAVTDNFFQVGGDSIKAVQIASRLMEKGISVKVKDILTYQTITQISRHATAAEENIKYEQGIVEGERSFTPIEKWFFAQRFNNIHYYNQSILLDFNKPVNVSLLETAFKKLIEHHDGLRINYNPDRHTLFYNNRHLQQPFLIAIYNTHNSTKICQNLKNSFDITSDLLLKAAIINNGGEHSLFITAHHLVVDGISWRILLEDLYTIYCALQNGETIKLPGKTGALTNWENKLIEHLGEEAITEEIHFWKEADKSNWHIPLDFATEKWQIEHSRTITGRLSKEKTGFLLNEANQVYRTDVQILLTTALARTLKEWTRQPEFVIELESHGRHAEVMDTSRTLGWFTAMYPVKFVLKENATGSQIKSIKEQIKNVPDNGIGYGIYKYGTKNANNHGRTLTEIRFNYLGQFDKEFNNELFTYNPAFTGTDIDPKNNMTARLELNVMIMNGALNMDLHYNCLAHHESTITWFRDTFLNHVEHILEHVRNERNAHFTPSDFDAVNLDQQELDALFL